MRLLIENVANLHRRSSWSEWKRKLEADERYKAIESSTTREDWFRDYIRTLKEPVKQVGIYDCRIACFYYVCYYYYYRKPMKQQQHQRQKIKINRHHQNDDVIIVIRVKVAMGRKHHRNDRKRPKIKMIIKKMVK
jgi:hypothetical protein